MYEIEKHVVEEFINNNMEYYYILYLEGIKEESKNQEHCLTLHIYYVDNDMKLGICNTEIKLRYDSLVHVRKHCKNRIDKDRLQIMNYNGYDVLNGFGRFNTSFTSLINKNKDMFMKKMNSKDLTDKFASMHGMVIKYGTSSLCNLIYEEGIECDFRNYSDCSAGFDTIVVDIPLIRRGRNDDSQRKEIMKLKDSLQQVALKYIKKDFLYSKYNVSLDSLYVSNLYHTRDDFLEFVFKVK